MTQGPGDGLVSPSDIADIAGVSRGAVSNWRRRADDFPERAAGSEAKPLFSRLEVTAWLTGRGYALKSDAGQTDVWAALNLMREKLSADEAARLVLSLAVARKRGIRAEADLPNVAPDALTRLLAAVDHADLAALAYGADFALERLARAQGKMGAAFGFVGSRTTAILASLAASRPCGVLYDPACGIAAALLEAVDLGARPERIVGHDISEEALEIAGLRAELHDVSIELSKTDVLAEDIDPALRADVIVLEPSFGVRLNVTPRFTDPRFDFGVPPRSSADTAWLQHSIAHLAETGRAYVLSPLGVLFRRGEEEKIRAELVRHGCVEAVVGLPSKMLPHTSVPLALWVLRRPVTSAATGRVLFIDAAEVTAPEDHVAAWLNDPEALGVVPHRAIAVPDILAAESVLTPRHWVDRAEHEPAEIANAYVAGWAAINDTMRTLQNILATTQHFKSSPKSRLMTVGELIEQGVLDLRPGRPKDRYDKAPKELRDRIVTASDVRDGTLRNLGTKNSLSHSEITNQGDVLATTMHTIRAQVDEHGGHLPSTGVYRLRVDPQVLLPAYLAIMLTGSWNERFQTGTTIQRAPIKDLEIPLIPLLDQHNFCLTARSLQRLSEGAANLTSEARAVSAALLDATRSNTPLASPPDATTMGRTFSERGRK